MTLTFDLLMVQVFSKW